jgi:hypothetical protein
MATREAPPGPLHFPESVATGSILAVAVACLTSLLSARAQPIVARHQISFSGSFFHKSMYSISSFSFLQKFLSVYLIVVPKGNQEISPINITATAHLRTATDLLETFVHSKISFRPDLNKLLLFQTSALPSSTFCYILRCSGNLTQYTGYELKYIRGSEYETVIEIWIQSLLCIASLMSCIYYNVKVANLLHGRAMFHRLNILRVLAILLVVRNLPIVILNQFTMLKWMLHMFVLLGSLLDAAVWRTLLFLTGSQMNGILKYIVAMIWILLIFCDYDIKTFDMSNPLGLSPRYLRISVVMIIRDSFFAVVVFGIFVGQYSLGKTAGPLKILSSFFLGTRLIMALTKWLCSADVYSILIGPGDLVFTNVCVWLLCAAMLPVEGIEAESEEFPVDIGAEMADKIEHGFPS